MVLQDLAFSYRNHHHSVCGSDREEVHDHTVIFGNSRRGEWLIERATLIELNRIPDEIPHLIRDRQGGASEAIVVLREGQDRPKRTGNDIPEGDLSYPSEVVGVDDVHRPIGGSDEGKVRIGPVFPLEILQRLLIRMEWMKSGTRSVSGTRKLHTSVQL